MKSKRNLDQSLNEFLVNIECKAVKYEYTNDKRCSNSRVDLIYIKEPIVNRSN